MRCTKLRKEVIDETGCLLEAAAMSFIMDGAEIQKTKCPVFPMCFINKNLNLSEEDVNWAINTLEENGWFTIENVTIQTEDGNDRHSIKWNLSEKAVSKIHIREKSPIGVDNSLIFEDDTQQVMQSLGDAYVEDLE